MPSAGAIGLQLFNKYFVKNEKDRRKKMLKKGHFILLFLFSFVRLFLSLFGVVLFSCGEHVACARLLLAQGYSWPVFALNSSVRRSKFYQ